LQYCLPYGKARGLQILCCQGINVSDYNFNLDALALKPADFCKVRVNACGLKTQFPDGAGTVGDVQARRERITFAGSNAARVL
jgi:hypothetical protein